MIEGYELEKKLEMDYASRKIALLGDTGNKTTQECFRVKKYQIDSNKHMNNVEYVRLAMETLPEKAEIGRLRVEYKKAALYDDEIMAQAVTTGDTHQVIMSGTDGSIYAIVEFVLK